MTSFDRRLCVLSAAAGTTRRARRFLRENCNEEMAATTVAIGATGSCERKARKARKAMLIFAVLAGFAFRFLPTSVSLFALLRAQTDPQLAAVQRAVSIVEIQKTLDAINVDRTSGKEGERQAADYLVRKLTEYGVKHTRYEARLYMSWPVQAEITVPGAPPLTIRGVTPAFGAATPVGGLTADTIDRTGNQPLGPDVRGKIAILSGGVSPDRTLAAQRAGVAGLIQIEEGEIVHEMIATTIWGSPTTESASQIPRIPIIGIRKSEGDRLKAALAASRTVVLTTKVDQGWATAPVVVADVPGKSPDFVMIATHLDAWYRGMTDTAGSDASILEMAHVLQAQQPRLERGVRFAWWPGHSFGRYAGSTWYVDRFWMDLDRHCVAYTNLDGPGRRGSPIDQVSATGWPGIGEYSRQFAQMLTSKAPEARGGGRNGSLFRPTRDSDSSFQGLGIPEFAIGVPGPPRGHPDLEPGGRISYWHTAQDTIEKLDPKVLELDTRYRVAQLYSLATLTNLPLKIAPIATSFEKAIEEIAAAAAGTFDLKTSQQAAATLLAAATRLDAAPRPSDARGRAITNQLLVRLTHRLNSRLYTKAGRFDQDPAANVPILPLLARARELPALSNNADAYGFLETELLRGRNAVEATLTEAARDIDAYLAGDRGPGTRN
jgi:N-acetylated-alpha-linked acidic dipeptidase